MIALTLGPGETALWWIALAVGVVVIGVVVALFTLLSRLLADMSFGVASLGEMAERLERASAGGDLERTASLLRELREEIRVHDERLSG